MQNYEELKCIGRGSYGSAHLVTEKATGCRFVIKKIPMELLSEQEKQQSFREVDLLAKLKHPNVVEYKENFVEGNVIHIVMAYCDGGDLAGRIRERAKEVESGQNSFFAMSQILDWFVQMAMAIKYLHEQRILHRDLKTSNIFLTTENVIKLGDFGIAKTLDSTLDQAKTVVGTPYYMSPEVCESKPYSYASDVWSLGCVLYEMCALKHAFDAPNILTLILKIVQQPFAPLPAHVDSEVSGILTKLLDKNPDHRPTMDQIFMMPYVRNHMQGLVASGGSLKVARRPHGTPKRRGKSGRRASVSETANGRRRARWVPITPQESESHRIARGIDVEDLELLDASSILDESDLDIRLPERSSTPEPLVYPPDEVNESIELHGPKRPPPLPPASPLPPPPPMPTAIAATPSCVAVRPSPTRRTKALSSVWNESAGKGATSLETRRKSAEKVEEDVGIDHRFHVEAGELMNPNFQNEYWNECNDSSKYYYSAQTKGKGAPSGARGIVRTPSRADVSHRDGHHRHVRPTVPPRPEGPPVGMIPLAPRTHQQQPSNSERGEMDDSVDSTPWGTLRPSPSDSRREMNLALSLDEISYDESLTAGEGKGNLSESGILRQLEMDAASSGDEMDDAYSSNSEYEGEENFYSEHSAYSEDSDFLDDHETEYSDDFEDSEAEIIEYANDEFVTDDSVLELAGIRSPKLVDAPRRTNNEVQWVMRNVAKSLLVSGSDQLHV